MPRRPRTESLVVGASLVAVGVVWMLSNLGRVDMLSTLRTFWPSSLILWGLIELFNGLVDSASGRASRGESGRDGVGRNETGSSAP